MSKVNRYEYEGKVIEIPLRWDEHSKKEIEDFFIDTATTEIYTPEGRPILLTIEDACPHAVMVEMMIPQVLTAVPAATSTRRPAHFWASAITKKCAPV